MNIKILDAGAVAVTMTSLIIIGLLLMTDRAVPEGLWAGFTLGFGFIFRAGVAATGLGNHSTG